MKSFLYFLSRLENPEKTRNFNKFKNYNLDEFTSILETIRNGNTPTHTDYKPFRISVVGTNGKGSTSHFLSEILKLTNPTNKVGLYTSPHLVSPLERISFQSEAIPEREADQLLESLNSVTGLLSKLSYFEFLTLFAFLYFEKQNCNFEIWEAGLGGRLDATKLSNPDVIVLTKIGLDHCEILGNDLETIAKEKIGIKGEKSKILFSFRQSPELETFIRNESEKLGLQVYFQTEEFSNDYLKSNFHFAKFVLETLGWIDQDKVSWENKNFLLPKGRMETLHPSPKIVFDPAHNPDAIGKTLECFLDSLAPGTPFDFLVGSLPDKDAEGIWEVIQKFKADSVYLWEGNGFQNWDFLKGKNTDYPPKTGNHFQIVNETNLVSVLSGRKKPLLVSGSFRLYGILQSAIHKTFAL
ncbi:bifunctional folylpolyglutamate synthase/dihydrofolate synthase [Leptospira kobayashii]|uniref:Bifunctional folylpolyglutamate synthase/dihydrofolate synthase n=1 Tax=Leptospira kobayashii TaxID=1917830 RepID=A0ABM7ULN0_9LEPT|nr:Mur ligase family protein [Leptospira kobayashii]BDA79789.1 bifunctional folylpolyglutamate synthase/dihydrofolate synthase [Leptospira kobayashii]